MARKVLEMLVCDLHDEEVDGDETVTFGLDGSTYEIDLCADHAAELRDALAVYVGSARRAARLPSARRGVGRPRSLGGGADKNRVADIRAWAKEQGLAVNERGRIPGWIVEQYDASH
jgi:hypothetical protein